MNRIEKSQQLLREDRVAEAEAELRQLLAEDRNSLAARVELMRILAASERTNELIKLVDESLKLAPNNADALTFKGLSLALRADYLTAIGYYRKAIAANPKLAMAYNNLGAALRNTDQLVESERILRQGLTVEPNNFHTHYELAQTLIFQMKIEAAIHEILATIKINPRFVRGFLALAKLYLKGEKPELAARILTDCLKINPRTEEIVELLKDCYLQQGDFNSAYQLWERVIAERGELTDYLKLGQIAETAKDFNRAEQTYLQAIELSPSSWQAHYALAELYDRASIKDRAWQRYRLAVQFNNGAYQPHNGLGLFLIDQGPIEEAISNLTSACGLAPQGEATPFYNLALALVKAKRHMQAKELLQRNLDQFRQHPLYNQIANLFEAIKRELGN